MVGRLPRLALRPLVAVGNRVAQAPLAAAQKKVKGAGRDVLHIRGIAASLAVPWQPTIQARHHQRCPPADRFLFF